MRMTKVYQALRLEHRYNQTDYDIDRKKLMYCLACLSTDEYFRFVALSECKAQRHDNLDHYMKG